MVPIKQFFGTALKFVDKNLPTILTWLALGGLGASVGTAIKETPKAQEAIIAAKLDKAAEIEHGDPDSKALDVYRDENGPLSLDKIKLTPWEGFKALAPVYWPCALTTLLTGGCIFFANRVGSRRYAALLAALTLKEKEMDEYKNKVKELFGEKKEAEIGKELNKDIAMDAPVLANDGGIFLTTHGTTLCCLPWTRIYFRTSQVALLKGFEAFRDMCRKNKQASLSDLVECLDIPMADTSTEDHFWWMTDDTDSPFALDEDPVHLDIDYGGNAVTGEPCWVVTATDEPAWVR